MDAPLAHQTEACITPGTMARGLVAFRRFVSVLLIIALSILVTLLLLKDNLDHQIRTSVQKQLTEVFSGSNVTVELSGARYHRGEGIQLEGLVVREGGTELASIDRVFVATTAEVWDLVRGKVKPELIAFDGVSLWVRHEATGKLNLQRIFGSMRATGPTPQTLPRFAMRNCRVHFSLAAAENPIEVQIPVADFRTDPEMTDARLRMKLEGDHFREVQISAKYSSKSRAWQVIGNAEQLQATRKLYDYIPASYRQQVEALNALQAKLDFDFDVSGQASTGEIGHRLPEFVVAGKVTEGSIRDKRLPFPIRDLKADFVASNSGVKIENVVAESSIGKINLDVLTHGLNASQPLEVIAKVDSLYLNRRQIQRLPVEAQEFLNKYSPEGTMRLNARMSYDRGRWVPDVRVDLLDMSFAFHKFPYPIEKASGKITLDAKKIDIDIRATASGRRVTLRGGFWNPGPDSVGSLLVNLDGEIPVDNQVFAALKQLPDVARTIQQFHPRGQFGFSGLLTREPNRNGDIAEHFEYTIPVRDVEVNYDLFPIPFTNVSGTILIRDGNAEFKNFRGKNVHADTYAQGSWNPEQGLDLTLESFYIELNNSLHSALPKVARSFWETLRPSGSLQTVRARITKQPRKPMDYVLVMKTDRLDASVNVQPTWFPYEVKSVVAEVEFRPDRFEIKSFRGKHRDSTLTFRGDGTFDERGWSCNLRDLHFDRMRLDRDLISAMPQTLGDTLESLDIGGMFNLRGFLAFKSRVAGTQVYDPNQTPIQSVWDLTADVDQGSIECGVPLEEIYGAVRLTGTATGERFQSTGGMELDSLIWNDLQFKQLRAPIYLDNNEALLGVWATTKRRDAASEPLRGKLFGGDLAGNAKFSLHGKQPFEIQGTLNNGDLNEFTFDLAPEYNDIVGRGFGRFFLTGDNTGTHSLRGKGEVRLVDAKIYEVPVILGLLKLLSVNQIDRTLFNESNIDVTLRGEHIFFDRLEFLGDAISLKGNGEMNFDQEIDLQFYTLVGRDRVKIPVISPLLRAASQQILVIDVDGTTQKPNFKKNFFKMLNDNLKSNLEDFEDSLGEGSEALLQASENPLGRFFR